MSEMATITMAEYRRLRRIEDAALWCSGAIPVAVTYRKAALLREALKTVAAKLAEGMEEAGTAEGARERASQDGEVEA